MSIDQAELLKRELTDKWVVVASQVPELRRFESLTGQVKTVNMNCRALVEFDGPEDIGWYDIDPGCLTVVDGPKPKEKPTAAAKEKPAAPAKAAGKPAAGGSPLDAIRAQGGGAAKPAAKPAGGSPLDAIRAQGGGAAKAAPAAGGSPLDKIRAQGAGAAAPAKAAAEETATPEPAAAEPAEQTPPSAPPTSAAADMSGMSPLDAIRAQGGFKNE